MDKKCLVKILICLVFFSSSLCMHINITNNVTKSLIKIPALSNEVSSLEEEVLILQYQFQKFESPDNLLALLKTKEYAHLVPQVNNEIICIEKDNKKNTEKSMIEIFSGKALLGAGVR